MPRSCVTFRPSRRLHPNAPERITSSRRPGGAAPHAGHAPPLTVQMPLPPLPAHPDLPPGPYHHGTPFTYDTPANPRDRWTGSHWNSLLGYHLTPNLSTAQRVAQGLHDPPANPIPRILSIPHPPTRVLHFASEQHLDDALAYVAVTEGIITAPDLHDLWSYSTPDVHLPLYTQTLQCAARAPGSDDADQHVLADIFDFGFHRHLDIPVGLASVVTALRVIIHAGYDALSYVNTHADEVQRPERTLILPFPEQLAGPTTPEQRRAWIDAEYTQVLADLRTARTTCAHASAALYTPAGFPVTTPPEQALNAHAPALTRHTDPQEIPA